tara:strand:+ start:17626 stop:18243 length:618 start_codon:yes stop_codon:yes gene_type:complete
MLSPQLNKHQIKIWNIFNREYKILIISIFSFVGLLFLLSIFFPEFIVMTAIFFFGGLIVTIYLWVYQASKLLTKSYILIESEGTDSKVYEWLEVWLPKEKLLNETPTDFLWSMDLNPMKKNEDIVIMDSVSINEILPFNPFSIPTSQTKVKSLDVARTLEQSASKRLFKAKPEVAEVVAVGLLVACLLGVGYGIIMLIESGTKGV